MESSIKTYGDDLVGSRVKVLWPKDKSFCEGIVSSHGHSGKNLVIHADGLEKVLKFKAEIMNTRKDGFADKGRETRIPPSDSSYKHSGVKDYGEALVGCTVKVWRHESKTWSEGTVIRYYSALKKHLVSYGSGVSEILNLYSEPEEPATCNLRDHGENPNRSIKQEQPTEETHLNQDRKRSNPAPSSDACPSEDGVEFPQTLYHQTYMSRKSKDRKRSNPAPSSDACPGEDGVEFPQTQFPQTYMSKKFKGQSCSPLTAGNNFIMKSTSNSENETEHEQKIIDPEISQSQLTDVKLDVNGYKVNATASPILEAIFAKYGDISKDCLFKSPLVRASLLEVVCSIVLKLQDYNPDTILHSLETIQSEVSDVEAAKIDVSWLTQHLAKFQEASGFHEKNLSLKSSKKNVSLVISEASDSLRERRCELFLAVKRVKEAKKYVDVMKLVSRKIDKEILASENEEYFWRRRLGGLLEPEESFNMHY